MRKSELRSGALSDSRSCMGFEISGDGDLEAVSSSLCHHALFCLIIMIYDSFDQVYTCIKCVGGF